jgi:molybdate transport repressor ModE-like protein
VLPVSTRVPDLAALRLLVDVSRTGSIGGAARASGVSQQAASERLQSVEAQTGLVLLDRRSRGSELTAQGVVVVEWAKRLLELADEIDHAIDGLRDDRTRDLAVWSSMTIAESLLPRWLVLLRQRQEAEGLEPTTVSFVAANSSQVSGAVQDGRADVGFVEGTETPAGLRSATLAEDELVLVTAPGTPLSRRRTPLTPEEVGRLTTTSREAGSGTRAVVARALRRAGVRATGSTVELTTATAVREAVVAGGPPAYISRRVVRRELETGALVVVATSGLDVRRTFRAVWRGQRQPPAGPVRELVGIARGPAS